MPDVIAHRGVATEAPENSLAAFEQAIRTGADGIEFDVRLSADGQPFVFHNFELDLMSSGKGPLNAYSAKDLRGIRLPARGGDNHSIPTLQDVLDLAAGDTILEIELKALEPEIVGIVGAALAPYRRQWSTMEITSFEPSLLRLMSEVCSIPVDVLTPPSQPWMTPEYIAYAGIHRGRLSGARAVHLHASQVSARVVETIRSAGFSVHVHGVDTRDDLSTALDLEIERFDTDRLLEVIHWLTGSGFTDDHGPSGSLETSLHDR